MINSLFLEAAFELIHDKCCPIHFEVHIYKNRLHTICYLDYSRPSSSGSCYYAGDVVQLANGEKRRIDELKIGDQVWSIDPYFPNQMFVDEIILMAHNGPHEKSLD